MHLELTPEAILKQLSYPVTEQTLAQLSSIMENTPQLEKFLPHLPSFTDALAVEKGYVAMSNSKPYLKVKCDADQSADNLSAFTTLVEHWADKYKLQLQKANDTTFYIIGHN